MREQIALVCLQAKPSVPLPLVARCMGSQPLSAKVRRPRQVCRRADIAAVGGFIGTYTFPNIIANLGGAGTYGGDTVSLVSLNDEEI